MMKKKKLKRLRLFLWMLLVCLIYCGLMVMSAFAKGGFADEYDRVSDLAGVLTKAEEYDLQERLDEISIRQKMDVTLVVTPDLGGYDRVSDYA